MILWRPIIGYPTYEISFNGEVRNWKNANGRGMASRPSKRKTHVSNRGYVITGMSVNGKVSTKYIHRLVASAFIPNLYNKPCVNHIDGNKLNNHVYNLEWVTHQENIDHAIKNGLWTGDYNNGEKSGHAKLTNNDVWQIRDLYERGVDREYIWKKYNISRAQMYRVASGENWGHI